MNNPSEHHDRLTEYLGRLRANLEGLPVGYRDDAYRELAQHIEALVDKAIAAGGDSDEIVLAALHKFGNPEKVGGELVSDYWADVFKHQRVARPKRKWMDFLLPWMNFLLPGIGGLCGLWSLQFVRALHLGGVPLVCAAMAFGSIIGIVTGWQWCRLARAEAQKPSRNRIHIGPFHFERARVVSNAVIWLMALVLAVIFWRAGIFTLGWPLHLSSTEREQNENEWCFVGIMCLCVVVVGKVTQKAFLRRTKQAVVSGAGK